MGLPGGPVVKTSSSSAGHVGSIPGQGAKIPTCLVAKKYKNIKWKQHYMKTFKKTSVICLMESIKVE